MTATATNLRVFRDAAPLKQIPEQVDQVRVDQFPRLQGRGPIEASLPRVRRMQWSDFRVFRDAAPLKPLVQGGILIASKYFRVFRDAAPLKPRHDVYEQANLRNFRVFRDAAPLKRMTGRTPEMTTKPFPRLQGRGPIEAGGTRGCRCSSITNFRVFRDAAPLKPCGYEHGAP